MELWSRRDYLITLFCQHFLISLLAVTLVMLIGLTLGVWVFYKPRWKKVILPVINFLYTIPSIAMFGLLLPIVGIGLPNALFVLILYGLLPIVRNTYTGLNEVPKDIVEAAEGLGSTPRQLFQKIYFPLALPSILAAMRVTTVMVISLTGLAALIGAGGLGQAIFRGLNTMNAPLIVIGSLGISAFAILGDWFVGTFEKKQFLQKLVTHNAEKKQKLSLCLKIFVLLLLTLFSLWKVLPHQFGRNERSITVATKLTTEQYLLGEIIAQCIEHNTQIKVNRKFGIGGGTTNIHPAMLKGTVDIYAEYTGTAWMTVLHHPYSPGEKISYQQLAEEYKKKFRLRWLGLLGFNNTYTLALPEKIAEKHHIRTFSDLANQSNAFTFGAEFDFFERPDAYPSLIKVYPFNFKGVKELDINLRYDAVQNGDADAIDAFTTDAQLKAIGLRALTDDKKFFPSYEAGIVMRSATAKKYPSVVKALEKLNGKISTPLMRKMNYDVEVNKKSIKQVAKEFLQSIKD